MRRCWTKGDCRLTRPPSSSSLRLSSKLREDRVDRGGSEERQQLLADAQGVADAARGEGGKGCGGGERHAGGTASERTEAERRKRKATEAAGDGGVESAGECVRDRRMRADEQDKRSRESSSAQSDSSCSNCCSEGRVNEPSADSGWNVHWSGDSASSSPQSESL